MPIRFCVLLLCVCGMAAACAPGGSRLAPSLSASEPEQMHRIYDFTPVSASNPLVARVVDTPIEIPMSEFQACLRAEVDDEERKRLTVEGRRKQLERLIEELVLLWDAYRQNADKDSRVADTLEGTRALLLAEFLMKEEVDGKAKSAEDRARLTRALRDRLFERASVVVSNEAYAALKQAVAAQPAASSDSLPAGLAGRPLARCNDLTVTIGEVWKAWAAVAPPERPDVRKPEALTAILKDLTEEPLKVAEALARGIDKTRPYREKVAANRAALTRMWADDHVTQEAVGRMRSLDAEARLRQWYTDNLKTRYTYKDDSGRERVAAFEEEKNSIRNDYFDHLREHVRSDRAQRLRGGRKVEVDERLVEGAG